MRLPVQVEGILFRKNKKKIEYLLLKRTKERGGFWQPVTGGMEKGESRIEALKREIQEETGVKKFIRIIKDIYYFEFSEPYLIKEYVCGVKISQHENIIIDKKEHSKYKWCSYKQALKKLKWKGNIEALKKLHHILSASKR